METTQALILLSIFNVIFTALVGGIVVYVVQKRIENSFAEKLEQFKAQLQYSNFEQQTRFATTHTKRLETLQGLYKKTALYSKDLFHIITQASRSANSLSSKHIGMSDYEKLSEKLIDFNIFFIENRLFLAENMAEEVEEIYGSLKLLHELAYELIPTEMPFIIDVFKMKHLLSNHSLTNKYADEEWESFDFFDCLSIMDNTMAEQVREIEGFYKSVAEAP